MKIIALLIAMVIFSATGFSQTKKIAHRSHSGKAASFSINGADNFGDTPEMVEAAKKKKEAEKLKADSLAKKAVADSLARITSAHKYKTKTKKKDGVIVVVTDSTKKQR